MEGIKVFISSTMDDLRGERDAAAEAIKELCLTPIRAEDFGPARRSPRDEYREKVEDSDIYVGILAKRDSQDVRDEFKRAKRAGKEMLIFVKKTGTRDLSLSEFINEIKEGKFLIYGEFIDEVELKEKLKRGLSNVLAERYRGTQDILGYIRPRIGKLTASWRIYDLTHTIEVRGGQGPMTISREGTVPTAEERSLPPIYTCGSGKRRSKKVATFVTNALHHIYTNTGTHIDFPGHIQNVLSHRAADARPSIRLVSSYRPEAFIGPAVVIDVSDIAKKVLSEVNHAGEYEGYLTWAEELHGLHGKELSEKYLDIIRSLELDKASFNKKLESSNLSIERGDFILFYTGLDDFWGYWSYPTDAWEYAYFLNPYLSDDLVQHLIELGIKGVGSDSFRLENPIVNLGRELDHFEHSARFWEISFSKEMVDLYNRTCENLLHLRLLSRNILIIEQLTNMKGIVGKKVLLIALPPRIGLAGCNKEMFVRAVAIDFS